MATRKVVNKSSKKTQSKSQSKTRTQRAGRRVKKVTSKRRGGFLSTIATAAVPLRVTKLWYCVLWFDWSFPAATTVRSRYLPAQVLSIISIELPPVI